MAKRRRGKWMPCPEGELDKLSTRLQIRRQRRHFLQATAGAAAALVTGGLVYALLRPSPQPGRPTPGELDYGGIVCSRVKEQSEGYAKRTLRETLREQIQLHLSLCSSCRDFYKSKGLT